MEVAGRAWGESINVSELTNLLTSVNQESTNSCESASKKNKTEPEFQTNSNKISYSNHMYYDDMYIIIGKKWWVYRLKTASTLAWKNTKIILVYPTKGLKVKNVWWSNSYNWIQTNSQTDWPMLSLAGVLTSLWSIIFINLKRNRETGLPNFFFTSHYKQW